MLSDWQVGRSHRERRNFPMGGSFYTSLSILEYLELQNSRAKNLSNTPFDKEETLNVWWETGCEHAWVHGYTENTLRATFRNILDNTGTNKQEQPSQTIQLKSEIHVQLLIQKWPKTGEWVCGGWGMRSQWPPLEAQLPTCTVPSGWGAEGACGACWCRAEMLTALWLQWSPQ